MRWSRVGWPAAGYVSLEDVEGYPQYLARLVVDAPPSVAALASITWNEARFAEWQVSGVPDDAAGAGSAPGQTLHATVVVRTDEVLDTPDGLWRRWNHARVTLRFSRAVLEPEDIESLALLSGDVQVSRGEIAHVDADVWELRLLVSPTGELAVHFRDVAIEVCPVDGAAWSELEGRPPHGWHGPVPDGWVEWASPAVRAAAHGDIGGLSLELDGFTSASSGIDDLDPRWGLAPLHAAAWFDRRSAAEALLERGADVDLRDATGRTALDIARERGARGTELLLRAVITSGSPQREDESTGM
ncbi:ankyrin repeat domain-containing protein [Curtobacterium sp. NPDC089185]|uniref:ankyrin repeat domain-containing protein n=1 Tax=Curtobacterium sp. NPDC089185 TaxID=3154968 RepID=UPI00343AD845